MKTCPIKGCKAELKENLFSPPGTLTCPVHGMDVAVNDDLELALAEPPHTVTPTDEQLLVSRVDSLAEKNLLKYTTDRDLSGERNSTLTIENHGPNEVDIRFEFDPVSGRLVNILAWVDKRS